MTTMTDPLTAAAKIIGVLDDARYMYVENQLYERARDCRDAADLVRKHLADAPPVELPMVGEK